MDPWDGDIIRYFNIDIFFSTDVDSIFLFECYEFEYFAVFFCFFLHYLQDDIRLLGFWDVYCVEFLVVQVDTVLVVGFAHLAEEGFPVYCYTEIIDCWFYLFWEPSFEAEEVDVLDCSWALAGSDEGISGESGL